MIEQTTVALEDMTEADIRTNVARLRAEGENEHADELEAYWAYKSHPLRMMYLQAGQSLPLDDADFADADEVYVPRKVMTDADIAFNVSRLRAQAEDRLKHAAALEAYGKYRRARP